MTVWSLLLDLERLGVALEVNGHKLRYGRLKPYHLEQLVQHKPDVVAFLRETYKPGLPLPADLSVAEEGRLYHLAGPGGLWTAILNRRHDRWAWRQLRATNGGSRFEGPSPDFQAWLERTPERQGPPAHQGRPIIGNPGAIPADLRAMPQWVVWMSGPAKKGEDWYARKSGVIVRASIDNPQTWTTFEDALALLEEVAANPRQTRTGGDHYGASAKRSKPGLGFALTLEDPFAVAVFHGCRQQRSGWIARERKEFIDALASYTEARRDGTGVHVIIRGELGLGDDTFGSLYLSDHGKFVAVTGKHIDGTPAGIEDRQDTLDNLIDRMVHYAVPTTETRPRPQPLVREDRALFKKIRESRTAGDFAYLWGGNLNQQDQDGGQARYATALEGQFALLSHLRVGTGGDQLRMDRMFRSSRLFDAETWDQPQPTGGHFRTYGEMVIAMVLAAGSAYDAPKKTAQHRRGRDALPTQRVPGYHRRGEILNLLDRSGPLTSAQVTRAFLPNATARKLAAAAQKMAALLEAMLHKGLLRSYEPEIYTTAFIVTPSNVGLE